MERFLYVMIQDLDPPIHLQLGLGLGLGLGQDLYHPIQPLQEESNRASPVTRNHVQRYQTFRDPLRSFWLSRRPLSLPNQVRILPLSSDANVAPHEAE